MLKETRNVSSIKNRTMKLMSVILAMILIFSSSGINVSAAQKKTSKCVVIYFSGTGTTKATARKIQKTTKGQLLEIKAKTPYTTADLDYTNSSSRVYKEHLSANSPAESKIRPAISNLKTIQNAVKNADIVYIGYPIWWGEAPHILYTFVEKNNLKGKKVIPFCTSASSGMGNSAKNLRKKAKVSSKTKWMSGKNFYSVPSQTTINKWIKSLK